MHFYRPLSEAYVFTLCVCPQGGSYPTMHCNTPWTPPPRPRPPPPTTKNGQKKWTNFWTKKWTKFWTKNWTNILETFGGGGRGRYASCGHAGGLSCTKLLLHSINLTNSKKLEIGKSRMKTIGKC